MLGLIVHAAEQEILEGDVLARLERIAFQRRHEIVEMPVRGFGHDLGAEILIGRVKRDGKEGEAAVAEFAQAALMPQVETVMRRGEKSIPLSWFSISRARVVSRRLSRGSPMPMKTRLRIMGWSMRLSPSRIRATRTWLRISPAVMLRIKPIVPVLQNVQPIAQPICEDTHWAIRTEPSCRAREDDRLHQRAVPQPKQQFFRAVA